MLQTSAPSLAHDRHDRKPDLAALLADSTLLSALVSAAATAHPAVPASRVPVDTALDANMVLARQTDEGERRLTHRRHAIQTQLVATHALERQWRQKQSEMDRALAPAAPSSLYQRLAHGVHEQELVCRALEDSFLDSDNAATASEREVTDWVRRYRDAKKVYYARRESKARWDEGRVGGWR